MDVNRTDTVYTAKGSWLRDIFHLNDFLSSRRQRGRIRHICQDLLTLHRRIAAESPDASEAVWYARIVEEATGVDCCAVQAMLRRAEESFARWPVERALKFRDVVLYLAVTQYLKVDIAVVGVNSRFVEESREIVRRMIPANF